MSRKPSPELVAALKRERDSYIARGLKDNAQLVTDELVRLGADDDDGDAGEVDEPEVAVEKPKAERAVKPRPGGRRPRR